MQEDHSVIFDSYNDEVFDVLVSQLHRSENVAQNVEAITSMTATSYRAQSVFAEKCMHLEDDILETVFLAMDVHLRLRVFRGECLAHIMSRPWFAALELAEIPEAWIDGLFALPSHHLQRKVLDAVFADRINLLASAAHRVALARATVWDEPGMMAALIQPFWILENPKATIHVIRAVSKTFLAVPDSFAPNNPSFWWTTTILRMQETLLILIEGAAGAAPNSDHNEALQAFLDARKEFLANPPHQILPFAKYLRPGYQLENLLAPSARPRMEKYDRGFASLSARTQEDVLQDIKAFKRMAKTKDVNFMFRNCTTLSSQSIHTCLWSVRC